MPKLVSILLTTIDRYDLTVRCIGEALRSTGYDNFEFLSVDNGSQDTRVIDYIASLKPVYHRLNPTNEGCAQAHNQMLLRAKGDLFVLLDNDIQLNRPGWLRDLVETYAKIRNSGVSGIHTNNLCPEMHDPETFKAPDGTDVVIHPARPPKDDAVFGTRMFSREVLNKVGFFSETFGVYGLVDNAYNSRVYRSGFLNYYIGGTSGNHMDNDVGRNTAYRRMKDMCMSQYGQVFVTESRHMEDTNNFYVPSPGLR